MTPEQAPARSSPPTTMRAMRRWPTVGPFCLELLQPRQSPVSATGESQSKIINERDLIGTGGTTRPDRYRDRNRKEEFHHPPPPIRRAAQRGDFHFYHTLAKWRTSGLSGL